LFEKSIAGLLFAGFTIGSFSGTLFNLILGPAYVDTKVKINRKIKFFIYIIFSVILFININIYFNLEYTYEFFKDYIFKVDKFFYIVTMHSLLGSFFMTYAMYQRHKTLSYQNRRENVFIKDIICSLTISALLPLLYWFNNENRLANLYLISSLISVFFYKPLLRKFYKK
jgi:hypothetical protein